MSTPREIEFRLRTLGLTASAMKPHSIGYSTGFEPDRSDIREFQNDLYILAGKVDAVLEEYGKYFESLGIVSKQDVRDHFTNVLHTAITGNATYCIERGIEQRLEDAREAVGA